MDRTAPRALHARVHAARAPCLLDDDPTAGAPRPDDAMRPPNADDDSAARAPPVPERPRPGWSRSSEANRYRSALDIHEHGLRHGTPLPRCQDQVAVVDAGLWRPWWRPSVGRRRHPRVAGRWPTAWRHHVRRHRRHRRHSRMWRHPRMWRHAWRHWWVAHAWRRGAGRLWHPLPGCRSGRRLRHALVRHVLPCCWYVHVRDGLLIVGPVLDEVHDVFAPRMVLLPPRHG